MNLRVFHCGVWVALALASYAAHAQSADRSRIETQAGSGSSGRLAINQAAGVGNAQANVMAVAAGNATHASADVSQAAFNPETARSATSSIESGAFNGFQGALALNQAAGANTLQANILVIAPRDGITATDDRVLAQVAPGTPPTEGAGSAPEVSREARIDATAFRGASGVLQVNQSAGVGNVATNAVVVRLPASAGGI